MQSSEGMKKLIRIIERKIIINGVVYKSVLNLQLKSKSIPKYFMEIILLKTQTIEMIDILHQNDPINIVMKYIFSIYKRRQSMMY